MVETGLVIAEGYIGHARGCDTREVVIGATIEGSSNRSLQ